MFISKVLMRNYRNFKSAEFRFDKGINSIVGENGSGKTNALRAIRLLLDESLTRNALQLNESDFNRSIGSWKGHWVIISIDFDELDPSESCQIIAHNTAHNDSEPQTGTYTFMFRPRYQTRLELFQLSNTGTRDQLVERISQITLDEYEPVLTGRATADFTDDAVYSAIAGNHEAGVFPNPEEDDQLLLGTKALARIDQEISLTFAKALRNVVEDLRGYRGNPLLSLLKGAGNTIDENSANGLLSQVVNLNQSISSLSEVRSIGTGLSNTLMRTVGTTYAPHLNLVSSLPSDIESLLRRLELRVGDPSDIDYRGDITEISLGGANLLFLSLKLLEYESKLASNRAAHFLLIEEPEAHIHTHVQKTLFDRISIDRTQVIVSTHSTHLSASSRISRMNVLAQADKHAKVFWPSEDLDPSEADRVERYLDAVRTTLLFAKSVMLVEGDAELILIPCLVREVFGIGLDELGISLISVDSSVFTTLAQLFDQKRIQRRCAIVSDLDRAFIELPDDPENDNDVQKKARASQDSGAQREIDLSEFCDESEYRSRFLATHTFEADFLLAGNSDLPIAILTDIYTQQAAITRSTEALENANEATSASEMLRLANKCGKGWFALAISRHVSANSKIPEYILRALAFLYADNCSRRSILIMAQHRLETLKPDRYDRILESVIDTAIQTGTEIDGALTAAFELLPEEDPLRQLNNFLEGDD